MKIKVCGILIASGSPLDKTVPKAPGIWDYEGCGSARHMARLADGTLFDLGNAGSTKHLCHVGETFEHHPVDQLEIITPPDDIPVARHHAWLEARNYAWE
ncbi:MAG: hypothetical protein WC693_03770 [Patescibacteria group bacterium]|jgi:hypothetical protein